MKKKSINYFETSNMAVEIRRMCCPSCEGEFYELDDHELDKCPLCKEVLFEEPETMEYNSTTFTLIVDHKTGDPSVIRNDECEPVQRDSAIDPTESPSDSDSRKGSGGSYE